MGQSKKKRMRLTPVLPGIPTWGFEPACDLPEFEIDTKRATPMKVGGVNFQITGAEGDPVPTTETVLYFLEWANGSDDIALAMEIAVAHMIAKKALSDPFWRFDRYRSRIDEYIETVWLIAQAVYEENSHLQVPHEGARCRDGKPRGYYFPGIRWSSAKIPKREA